MAFTERLHPRAHNGKFAKSADIGAALKGVKVKSRRRNGDAVDEVVAKPPASKLSTNRLTPGEPTPGMRVVNDRGDHGSVLKSNNSGLTSVQWDGPGRSGHQNMVESHALRRADPATDPRPAGAKKPLDWNGNDGLKSTARASGTDYTVTRATGPGNKHVVVADRGGHRSTVGVFPTHQQGRDAAEQHAAKNHIPEPAERAAANDKALEGGPKAAAYEDLLAAEKDGRKVQMHRFDWGTRTWEKAGDPTSSETARTLASNALKHKQTVRLTVEPKSGGDTPAAADRPGRGPLPPPPPAAKPGRKLLDTDGNHLGYAQPKGYEAHRTNSVGTSTGTVRGRSYRALRPDGSDLGRDFYHVDDVKSALGADRFEATKRHPIGDRLQNRDAKVGMDVVHPTHGPGVMTGHDGAGVSKVRFENPTSGQRLINTNELFRPAGPAKAAPGGGFGSSVFANPGKQHTPGIEGRNTGGRDRTERVVSRNGVGAPLSDTAKGGGAADRIKAGQDASARMAFGGRTPLTKDTVRQGQAVQHVSGRTGTVVDAGSRQSGLVQVKYGDGSTKSEYLGELTPDTGQKVTGPAQHADALIAKPGDVDKVLAGMSAEQAGALYRAVSQKIDKLPSREQRQSAERALLVPIRAASQKPAAAPAAAAGKGKDKGPQTYDRLPSGLVQNRNPWHPPDLDESKLDYQRDSGGAVNVSYAGKPLGRVAPTPNGQYTAEVAGHGPIRAHPGHPTLKMPETFASNQDANEAIKRATAKYDKGELIAYQPSTGPAQYADIIAHHPERGTWTVGGHGGKNIEIGAHRIIGRDNRKKR